MTPVALRNELRLLWRAHQRVGLTGKMCLHSMAEGSVWPSKTPGLLFWFGPDEIELAITHITTHYNKGIFPNTPLLLIAGTDDQHTKVPESERLFAAARQPKDLWIVPGAGHFNMHSYAGREYKKHISDFLAQYLRPGSREQTWFRKNQ